MKSPLIKWKKRAKFEADSLFLIEYQSILKEQDSICTLRKQASLKTMVDSIVDIRKKEIIQLQKGL